MTTLTTLFAKAVLYLRVSDDRKGKQKSLREQEADARRDAERENLKIVRVFADNDKSASRFAKKIRPDYRALREYLETGDVDVLILWESSRGSRELEDWAGLLNLCRRMEVAIHVVTHGRTYDLDNPRDWRTLAEDGIDSQYESEKSSLRVRRAIAASQAAGTPHGKLLYGYQRVFDRHGDIMWEIHEEQAAIIREAAERAENGDTLYAIAQDFNNRGIPTPRTAALSRLIESERDMEKRARFSEELETAKYQWDATQIKRLCTNPAYIAKRASQSGSRKWKVHGDAVWPAILKEETYQSCVDILNRPERDSRRHTDATIKHLLSGIAQTPCGGTVRLLKNRGYLTYSCELDSCVGIVQHRLDAYVEEQVRERLVRLEINEFDGANPNEDAARKRVLAEAEELRQYLEDFTREAIAERLSAARVAAVERDITTKIADLEARARRERIPRVVWTLIHEPQRWDEMTMPQKRETLRRLVTITILPIGRGKRSYETCQRVDLDWTEYRLMRDALDSAVR